MRTPEEIHPLAEWMQKAYYARQGDAEGRRYVAGVVDSLRWTLGQRARAPITGRACKRPVSADAVAEEAYAVGELIADGRASADRSIDRRYVEGAAHALRWLTGTGAFVLPDAPR